MNPLRHLISRVSEHRARHQSEKAKKLAQKLPKKELFAANGWGPKSAFIDNADKPYRGLLYPAPDYAVFAKDKERPKYNARGQEMCNTARKYWWRGSLDKAEAYYRKAHRRDKQNPEYLFESAQLLWAEARLDDAKALVEKALEINPNFVSARVSLIRLTALLDGKVLEDQWQKYLDAEDPTNPSTHNAVAEMFSGAAEMA